MEQGCVSYIVQVRLSDF